MLVVLQIGRGLKVTAQAMARLPHSPAVDDVLDVSIKDIATVLLGKLEDFTGRLRNIEYIGRQRVAGFNLRVHIVERVT